MNRKTISFHAGKSGVKTLHVETDGCIIDICVGLVDTYGRKVTRIDVSPEDETRSPDMNGYYWRKVDEARVIRDLKPGMHVGPDSFIRKCRHCGAAIKQRTDGLWTHDVIGAEDDDGPALLECDETPDFERLHEPVLPEETREGENES